MDGSTDPRFSCLVTPAAEGGWEWQVYQGTPDHTIGVGGAPTLAAALEDAADMVRQYPEGDR